MDAFRCVELPDPYIYVIDPTDGHTKAVIDKFFSFLWVERRAEAGELEITAPEDTYWGTVIQEGDYVQFKASSVSDYFKESRRPSNVGRYTMVVEAKYTTFDADNGYTTYVKGHSLDILLNRRINLGIVGDNYTSAAEIGDGQGGNDYRKRHRDGYLMGALATTDYYNEAEQDEKQAEDGGWGYYGFGMITNLNGQNYTFHDPTMPYIIENVTSDSNNAPNKTYGIDAATVLTRLVDYNCGDEVGNDKRKFENFTVRKDNLAELQTLRTRMKAIDGRFENVYDLITELLPDIAVYTEEGSQTFLSMRLVGWTEGVRPYEQEKTVFRLGFELYKGRDLTINGPYKNTAPVIYSRDMDNLISMNYLTGEANYKNVIYYDTKYDYTPDDIWKRQKEVEALEKEKELLSNQGSGEGDSEAQKKKEKELEDRINKLNDEVDKLEKEYEDRGLRIPYISVIDREQYNNVFEYLYEPEIKDYPSGLHRRELYVEDDLPFLARVAPKDDNVEAEWQGRPFLKYRYTIKHEADQNVQGSKPWYEDKYLAVEWSQNTHDSIIPISATTFKKSENSRENDVEAELNYNAVYQPKRNYDIGDLVTVMGLRHNEVTRTAQIDEMAYSIDSSGYTIVPTFTILPIEDDAT